MRTGTVQIREGKGRKSRITCVGAKARKTLLRYVRTRPEARPNDHLFVTAAGDALNPNSLFLILKRIGAVAGVEHCNPHAFRRTFATWSTDQNMNVFSLQLLMGHADIATTRRYVDQSAAKLAEAHRRYGPVDNML